jgi:hypothetical protein
MATQPALELMLSPSANEESCHIIISVDMSPLKEM